MRGKILMALVAVAATLQTAQAAVTLGDLVSFGGSITIGDKTFSDFGYIGTLDAGPILEAQAAGLNVTAFVSPDGTYYLDFAGGIAVENLLSATPLLGDLQIQYTVTSSGPGINMIDQLYTANALPGSGQIIIGETVAAGGIIVGNSTLTLNPLDLSDPLTEAGDNIYFGPTPSVSVVKDILIAAFPGQLVGLSDIQQSFHQVPEPTTLIAAGGAIAMLLLSISVRNKS